jgi:large subunit ribosomal protein L7/L12
MAEDKKIKKEDVLEAIGNMTVLELSELVKDMEEKFGVSAQQTVVQSVPGGAVVGAAGAEAGAAEEEKTEFDVVLKEIGAERIKVIRAVREVTSKGLKEAKDLVEGIPSKVKEAVTKEEAEKVKAKLEEAGAKAEIE